MIDLMIECKSGSTIGSLPSWTDSVDKIRPRRPAIGSREHWYLVTSGPENHAISKCPYSYQSPFQNMEEYQFQIQNSLLSRLSNERFHHLQIQNDTHLFSFCCNMQFLRDKWLQSDWFLRFLSLICLTKGIHVVGKDSWQNEKLLNFKRVNELRHRWTSAQISKNFIDFGTRNLFTWSLTLGAEVHRLVPNIDCPILS